VSLSKNIKPIAQLTRRAALVLAAGAILVLSAVVDAPARVWAGPAAPTPYHW
jgi:hypothetical protein